MNINDVINIEDLHQLAKRKLPKVMFDYIEGGVEDERGLSRNEAAFSKHQLLPRYLVDVSKRDQSQTIFGKTFASPFGISPTGGAGVYPRRRRRVRSEIDLGRGQIGWPSLDQLGPDFLWRDDWPRNQ